MSDERKGYFMIRTKFITHGMRAGLALAALLTATVFSSQPSDPTAPIKTLQFQSADIKSVLTFLADYGQVNVVISPEVKGTVTIKLNNVQWRGAMDIIGRTYDLAVVDETDGYVRVLPMETFRKEQSDGEKHKAEQKTLVDLETKIVKISNSTSKDIETAVKSLLSDRGKVTADPRSNSVIIQEVPLNLEKVIAYIGELDKPSKQIKISAQLLEISSSDLAELGFNLSAQGEYVTESGRRFPQEGESTGDRVLDHAGSYSVTAFQKGYSIDALVQAAVTTKKGKIIAHPEITTLDNVEAKIQLGQKVPIKQFDQAGNVVIKFEEVGTILVVVPHITADNQILMSLKPERSTFEFDPAGVIINTSNASTKVIVSNGQTAVIGGLTTADEVETETGIPILKDIPILGSLFKYTNKKIENRDLVIFVTPTIIDALAMETPLGTSEK
jgi:type IV pilus secretin PilQ/predicted competence protein